ncbi:unnamed protein product [Dibothriocephalus latus]|uniref:Peptidase A1 domain-containing protein n=1 Tax=Dibothriocephalus latus TaxID=60516 RepID=A0A3P7L0T2_DIBLA|nr:unnamed protein product [Dibothriocephalus latus]
MCLIGYRIVPKLFLLSLTSVVYCNVEDWLFPSPAARIYTTEQKGSYFGYSVASYSGQSKPFCLVGAPNARKDFEDLLGPPEPQNADSLIEQIHGKSPGSVYRLDLDPSYPDCDVMPIASNNEDRRQHGTLEPGGKHFQYSKKASSWAKFVAVIYMLVNLRSDQFFSRDLPVRRTAMIELTAAVLIQVKTQTKTPTLLELHSTQFQLPVALSDGLGMRLETATSMMRSDVKTDVTRDFGFVSLWIGGLVAATSSGDDGLQLGCDPRYLYTPSMSNNSLPGIGMQNMGTGTCALYTGVSMQYTPIDACVSMEEGTCLSGFSGAMEADILLSPPS